MGILDSIRGKIDEADKAYNPLRKAADAIAAPPAAKPEPAEAKTPQQRQYEAREKAMNRNNPHYKDAVPRAKGGPVKAGGCRMKNVDNSGMSKERIK